MRLLGESVFFLEGERGFGEEGRLDFSAGEGLVEERVGFGVFIEEVVSGEVDG